ncbi:Alanine dehydrogenase [Rubripirellula tenax]|uniref:Alanine dehydrogenase n=1 Tax=Rubripirellula tenax TaxID=2528015 RepID=A0A5C6ERV9_9BACT|nr:alanine dehydrogenase [Rubripirellula tenax]TWU50827.1 Alanine dehydrogenase [Rubripirellula tenax]
MIIGVPREVKTDEYRVAMLPVGVESLVQRGHSVVVETGAGLGSGIADHDYLRAGAEMAASGADVFSQAELIVKVKEPQSDEYPHIRPGQILFTYFHFAASRSLTDAMIESGSTCIAYETLRDEKGRLPLLTPMSEVAGRMSIQEGAKYLEKPQMGRGILLGGVPGVAPAHITILGGGIVGANAARIAAGFQVDVAILDVDLDRLRYLDDVMPANVNTLYSDRHNILEQIERADLVIGSVLIPGAKAPQLVRAEDLKRMKAGSVIIDVAVDQGGCIETSRPTTHSQPTYVIDEVVHYCVANMPGAVGRTSTFALCNATTPWVIRLADLGLDGILSAKSPLRAAINIHAGKVVHPGVASAFDRTCESL